MNGMIPEPAATDPDAAADAIRDNLAGIRATYADDTEAVNAVADNMDSPRTVACLAWEMIAQAMRDTGIGPDVLAQWQESAGL